jgi:metal-sulfur cluster biosynthetic enzyme
MNHVTVIVMGITFPECPVRMKEVAEARVRAIQQISYVVAVKIAEGVSRDEMGW